MADDMESQQKNRGGEGRRFGNGESGNPAGRPPGTKNKFTLAVERLFEGQAQAISQKAITVALAGDTFALKLCLERVAPVRRGWPVHFTMPTLNTADDLVQGLGSVLQAVATGDLTPDEGSTVAGILDAKRRAIEAVTIEQRLVELEKLTKERR